MAHAQWRAQRLAMAAVRLRTWEGQELQELQQLRSMLAQGTAAATEATLPAEADSIKGIGRAAGA
ncbi:hypothetical protein HaLaN_09294, partial [Haematococcus lacustris]